MKQSEEQIISGKITQRKPYIVDAMFSLEIVRHLLMFAVVNTHSWLDLYWTVFSSPKKQGALGG